MPAEKPNRQAQMTKHPPQHPGRKSYKYTEKVKTTHKSTTNPSTRHLAMPVHHTSQTRPLIWRFRFIIYLKHTLSFGDSGSSYILNMPLIWRFRFSIYILSTPHDLAIRFRFIKYLKHAPPIGRYWALPVHHPPAHLTIPVPHVSLYKCL